MTDSNPALAPEGVRVADTGAGRFQVEVQAAGVRFLADEPVSFGGLGSGPNPYDLLSAALGACTAMTLRLYAQRKAWPLTQVEVRVVHSRDAAQVRDLFTREIALQGALDEAQSRRLLEIADRCPVHRTLERGSLVQTRLAPAAEVEAAPVESSGQHMRDMDEVCA
jgi:putative redox protein